MNKGEARVLLAERLAGFRSSSYEELLSLLDQSIDEEVLSTSGTRYYVQVQIFWDDPAQGTLRVMGAIDDGRWRAFAPLTDDFILAPDGSFIGEE